MKHSSKIIYATLFISIAIHVWLLLSSSMFAPKTATETELKPVTVTLQQYTLEEPPLPKKEEVQETQVDKADNQPKPITKEETPVKTKAQSKGESNTVSGLAVKPIKPKGPSSDISKLNKKPIDQPASENSDTKSNNSDNGNNKDTEPVDDDGVTKQAANSQDQAKSNKLSLQDIENNNGIIAPKGNQKPSFPKVAVLRYQGPGSITGTMNFNRGGGKYNINAQFNIPFYKVELSSNGRLADGQFAPEKFTDKRKGKLYSQAIFDYENNKVQYGKASGDAKEEDMSGIPQDYLSLAWQMALNGGKLNKPTQVTSGKTLYIRDNFTPEGEKELDTNEGKIKVQVFRINKGDDGIEFAFAPDFANIPAQIVLYRDGKKDTLNLIGITLDGVDYWQAIRRSAASKNK